MFKKLSSRLLQIIKNINKHNLLTEENIKDSLNEVRISLLEADVALPVVSSFINTVKEKVVGKIIRSGFTPSQEFIKIVHDSLVQIMGTENFFLNLTMLRPTVFLIVGFQGSGKTTTCAKLAKYLRIKKQKRVLLSSVDIYRPSGIKQLEVLSNIAESDFFFVKDTKKDMVDIATEAFSQARLGTYDVLLVDTVGCLSTDAKIVSKIVDVASFLNPSEILFVADSMLGQEASSTASFFNSELSLTGIVLTKVDGDSRGGAALSIYHTIKKPIKFIGTGEKIDDLEPFYPSRIVDRILGMGDVLSLIEDLETKVKNIPIQDTLLKFSKGNSVFDLFDFLNYLKQMRSMGGVNKILDKLPSINDFSNAIRSKIDDKKLMIMEVIINSMTIEERKFPGIIRNSRKRRIAYGAGVSIHEVDDLLRRFEEVHSIMNKISKNGLSKMLNILQNKLFSGVFTRQ